MIITLAQIKDHLDITDTTDDAVLTSYIGQISDYLKTKIGRAIESADIVELFNGDDLKDTIFLGNYPVTELTSLQYRAGSFGSPEWKDFDANSYLLDETDGSIQVQAMYSGVKCQSALKFDPPSASKIDPPQVVFLYPPTVPKGI